MDKSNHYTDHSITNKINANNQEIPNNKINSSNQENPNSEVNASNENNYGNDRKPFLQRLGEANILPIGMVSTINDTDLVNLAITKGAEIDQEDNDR